MALHRRHPSSWDSKLPDWCRILLMKNFSWLTKVEKGKLTRIPDLMHLMQYIKCVINITSSWFSFWIWTNHTSAWAWSKFTIELINDIENTVISCDFTTIYWLLTFSMIAAIKLLSKQAKQDVDAVVELMFSAVYCCLSWVRMIHCIVLLCDICTLISRETLGSWMVWDDHEISASP